MSGTTLAVCWCFAIWVPAVASAQEIYIVATGRHDLGSLRSSSLSSESTPAEPVQSPAAPTSAGNIEIPKSVAEIREMFSTPNNLRKAVILSEILDRPEHRW